MVSSDTVERMARFTSKGAPVLSVYLDLGPTEIVSRPYKLVLKTMLRELEEAIQDRDVKKEFARDAERVTEYVATELMQRGRGLAIFSCQSEGLWEVQQTALRLPNRSRYEPTPYVKPLVALLSDNPRYCITLVDKEKARVITLLAGEVEHESEMFSLVPGKHKQGGWSSADFQRHHDVHVHWHVKDVAGHLEKHCQNSDAGYIILAGPEEPLAELRRVLPKSLSERVVGTISAPLASTTPEVVKEVMPLVEQLEREREVDLVDRLFALAGQDGGLASLGPEPTLAAAQQSRIDTLLVSEGLSIKGSRCRNCNHVTVRKEQACPSCSGTDIAEVDLADAIVEVAEQRDGKTNVLRGDAAARLQAGGGVGALLRF
jgi:peptide subunit release factor 1 (eRF1)